MMSQCYQIEIQNHHCRLSVSHAALRAAIMAVLEGENLRSADVSVVMVDDPAIHNINREQLQHDFPTDVITFPLSDEPGRLEGELVVSLDTAAHVAAEHGWSLAAETVLYVVHGMLHLCGYDDLTDEDRVKMRRREREILSQLGSWTGGVNPTVAGWDDGAA